MKLNGSIIIFNMFFDMDYPIAGNPGMVDIQSSYQNGWQICLQNYTWYNHVGNVDLASMYNGVSYVSGYCRLKNGLTEWSHRIVNYNATAAVLHLLQ